MTRVKIETHVDMERAMTVQSIAIDSDELDREIAELDDECVKLALRSLIRRCLKGAPRSEGSRS